MIVRFICQNVSPSTLLKPGGCYMLTCSAPPGLHNCGKGCAPQCNATCLGRFHEWADYGQGFTGIRYAQTNTLSLPKTFQAVIIDTPVASGSIHSPFKQPAGRRLARGGLALAWHRRMQWIRLSTAWSWLRISARWW